MIEIKIFFINNINDIFIRCLCFIRFSAVFNVGIWNSVGDFTDDGEIYALKRKLPEYCLASRGVNTRTGVPECLHYFL